MVTMAPRFAGIRQFEQCVRGARMTPRGFDSDADLVVDEPNDPEAVAALQGALRDLRYPQLVSVVYDDTTTANVRQFKIDQGLPVPAGLARHDGVCGPGTSGRLNALFSPSPPPVEPDPPPPAHPVHEWRDLISFRPAVAVQGALNARFATFAPSRVVHAIEDARGPVNLDYYPVRVAAMPTSGSRTMTAVELLELVRRNLSDFVDGSPNGCTFGPYDPMIDLAAWAPPFLPLGFTGAVLSIDIFSSGVNVDDGSVVLSQISDHHWRFSTLWTPDDGGHPVSGNREWGFTPLSAGEFRFHCRAADRCTALLDDLASDSVFAGAHRLWKSFQRRLAAFVNGNGGQAFVETPVSRRHDWATVMRDHHRPSVEWLH